MTNSIENKIVAIRTSRGGRFNNGGHKKFYGFYSLQELPLHDELFETDGIIYDCNQNELISQKEYDSGVGVIDFDGMYNTWTCRKLVDLSQKEAQIVYDSCDDIDVKNYLADYKVSGFFIETEEE